MAVERFIKVTDDNAGCTGNAPRCFKAPSGATPTTGSPFTITDALKAGYVEDPNCTGFNSANTSCTDTGGNPGTGGAIGDVGIIYNPGNTLFVGVNSDAVVEAELRYSSGVTVGYTVGGVFTFAIDGKNYNRRIIFSNPSRGTATLTVRIQNTTTTKTFTLSLGDTTQNTNLTSTGNGTNPTTPTTGASVTRAGVIYNAGAGSFIVAELANADKALQFRVVSNGYDSNWLTMGSFVATVASENYSLRGQFTGVPAGTHNLQFRLEGQTTLLLETSFSIGNASQSFKIYPAGGTTPGGAQSINAVGYQYQPNSFIILLANTSTKPQLRIFNGSYDSGFKDSEAFDTTQNNVAYGYRVFVTGIPKGTYTVQVKFENDTAARVSLSNQVLGEVQVSKNITGGNTEECVIRIDSLAYDNVLGTISGSVTGPEGLQSLGYAIDGQTFKQSLQDAAFRNLANGTYTLTVKWFGGNADCVQTRQFTVGGCVTPVKNAASVLKGVTTPLAGDDFTSLKVNYGTSGMQFKYVIYPNTLSGKYTAPVYSVEAAGGDRTLDLSALAAQPYTTSGAPQYLLEVQQANNSGCYSDLEGLTIVP